MTVVAMGIPSAFTIWGFEAIRHLAQLRNPTVAQIGVDRLDPFEWDPQQAALIIAQFPSRSLRSFLATQPVPVVLFTTSAAEAVRFQRQHQPSLTEAVRTIGASVALVGDCRPLGSFLRIDQSSRSPSVSVVADLAGLMGITLSAAEAAVLLEMLGPIPEVLPSGLSEAEEGIVTLVLENSVAHLGDPTVPIKSIWPHRVFFSGDRPNEEAPLVADATGGSRILYYGPYFHMAEGRWRAKVTLGFTKETVGLPLKISAWGPGLLGQARFRPRQEGIFAAPFSFTVTEPEHPVELHIRTEEGAIEGRIALGQVELSHVGPV